MASAWRHAMLDRSLFRCRLDQAHRAGLVTRTERDAGEALVDHCHRDTSTCHPSHGRIAEIAACSIKTVQRALQKLRSLGFLFWPPPVRVSRTRFATCRYLLSVPTYEQVNPAPEPTPPPEQSFSDPVPELPPLSTDPSFLDKNRVRSSDSLPAVRRPGDLEARLRSLGTAMGISLSDMPDWLTAGLSLSPQEPNMVTLR